MSKTAESNTLVTLSRKQHREHQYHPRKGYAFTRHHTVSPILLAELANTVPEYCLAFRKKNQGFELIAIQGLDRGNAYLQLATGKWLGHYVPAIYRAYPFKLVNTAKNKPGVLTITAQALCESGGEALFDEQGELAEPVKDMLNFIQECDANYAQTQQATDALTDAALIKPWPLKPICQRYPDGVEIKDLYKVDEQALNQLDAQTFADLRKTGGLLVAYGQLFSMSRIKELVWRLDLQDQISESGEMPDLEDMFGGADDSIQFD